jgi:hypothetical protein
VVHRKGRFSNGSIAMLPVGRYVAGRGQNSLVAGPAPQGGGISAVTLAVTWAQAGAPHTPLEEQTMARSLDLKHLHADETSWHVLNLTSLSYLSHLVRHDQLSYLDSDTVWDEDFQGI